jgi:hypothetical protein
VKTYTDENSLEYHSSICPESASQATVRTKKEQFVLNTANKAKNFWIRLRLRSLGDAILKAFVASAFLRSQDPTRENLGTPRRDAYSAAYGPLSPLPPSGVSTLLRMLTSLPR